MSGGNDHPWISVSISPSTTTAMGETVGRCVRAGDLIALRGELGAGKTQFVRGLAAGMNIDAAAVSSPTFVIVHEYSAAPAGPVLVHIDAYRIHGLADLESIGWDITGGSEMRKGAVVVIEWAERFEGALGDDLLAIDLAHAGENQRRITMRPSGGWTARWPTLRDAMDKIVKKDPPPGALK